VRRGYGNLCWRRSRYRSAIGLDRAEGTGIINMCAVEMRIAYRPESQRDAHLILLGFETIRDVDLLRAGGE